MASPGPPAAPFAWTWWKHCAMNDCSGRKTMYRDALLTRLRIVGVAAAILTLTLSPALSQGRGHAANAPAGPWMNKSLSPDERADLLIQQMTIDEKIQLLHGYDTRNADRRDARALEQQLTLTRGNPAPPFPLAGRSCPGAAVDP